MERQLNKSVLIGWTAPEGAQQANIESYHVYVDGVLKTTIKATERTRALVEGVDSNRVSKIQIILLIIESISRKLYEDILDLIISLILKNKKNIVKFALHKCKDIIKVAILIIII